MKSARNEASLSYFTGFVAGAELVRMVESGEDAVIGWLEMRSGMLNKLKPGYEPILTTR
jgi:hypothetical protein